MACRFYLDKITRVKLFSRILLLLSFFMVVSCSHFKAHASTIEDSLFFAFNEFCINKAHNFDSIRAAATVSGWQKLDANALRAMMPLDSSELQGWVASRNGVKFLLMLNTAYYSKMEAQACTVIGYNSDAKTLNSYVNKYLDVYDRAVEDTPTILTYVNLLHSDYGVPIKVHVSESKEPNQSVVKIEAYILREE